MTRRLPASTLLLALALLLPAAPLQAQAGIEPALLNTPVDVSPDFQDLTSTYFVADRLSEFDPATAEGRVSWKRHRFATRHAFNNTLAGLQPVENNEFPDIEYAAHPDLPFSLDFVTPRTVRIRMKTGLPARDEGPSAMLVRAPPRDRSWRMEKVEGGYRYGSAYGSVTVLEQPWHLEFRDAAGRVLTRTHHLADNATTLWPALPFSFVRRASDYARRVGPVFSLAPGEKIFGTGESFTRLDKRGQRVVLFVDDPNGAESEEMYKPIPFFMSSRGYGMFVHTSAPATFDFGRTFSGTTALMLGDDQLDLFVFLGDPKDILDEYTDLTGKAAMPPLWSFGFWMSRITYFSEEQVRDVASKLREHRIPSDVIHLDTGWFETDWRSDTGMSGTLRGGLSLGLSGFSFWSHDIGGFTTRTPEELYRRWLPFGMLTSHTRSHGAPPKEPWEYGPDFTDAFRRATDLRYRLMPYIYAQAKDSSERGLPMLRALFVEYPDDPGSWLVEDQYLLGTDILVAPLMEEGTTGREVYLPPGEWIDYQTGKAYAGGWHAIEGAEIPVVMMVRGGAAVPHIALAQSTSAMDWSALELVTFGEAAKEARGLVCLPSDDVLHEVVLEGTDGSFALPHNPLAGRSPLFVRPHAGGGD